MSVRPGPAGRALLPVALCALTSAWVSAEEAAAQAPPAPEQPTAILFGQIDWPGVDWLGGGHVVLATDLRFSDVVATVPIQATGRFAQMVPQGEYYLRAVVDLNADGKVSPGDGVGFYGAADPSGRPEKLAIRAEGEADLTVIRVIFQFGPDMKLTKAPTGLAASIATVTGTVAPGEGRCYVVLWSTTADWFGYAALVGDEGAFSVHLPPGPYAVLAFRDANVDARLDPAEPATVLLGEDGRPKVLSILPQAQVDLGALILADGWHPPPPRPNTPVQLPQPPAVLALHLALEQGQDAPRRIALFGDSDLSDLILSASLWPDALLALRPATYYLVCGVDLDEDGRLGANDLLAAGGEDQHASALALEPGAVLSLALGRVARISPEMLDSIRQGSQ